MAASGRSWRRDGSLIGGRGQGSSAPPLPVECRNVADADDALSAGAYPVDGTAHHLAEPAGSAARGRVAPVSNTARGALLGRPLERSSPSMEPGSPSVPLATPR